MVRYPAVAGMFYPATKSALKKLLNELWLVANAEPREVLAAMVPHAGYVFSGKTAAKVYASCVPADIYFLIGPNHSGRGESVALSSASTWETPLGRVPVDHQLGDALRQQLDFVKVDERAHQAEHALEVQLPFLQKTGNDFSIVPLALGTHQMQKLKILGEAIARLIKLHSKKCMVLASSDMNHFADLKTTQELDHAALQCLLAMDAERLMATVEDRDISMCGVGAAVVMLFAAKALGATHADLIAYTTSAEAFGDQKRVVGYAGVSITKK